MGRGRSAPAVTLGVGGRPVGGWIEGGPGESPGLFASHPGGSRGRRGLELGRRVGGLGQRQEGHIYGAMTMMNGGGGDGGWFVRVCVLVRSSCLFPRARNVGENPRQRFSLQWDGGERTYPQTL